MEAGDGAQRRSDRRTSVLYSHLGERFEGKSTERLVSCSLIFTNAFRCSKAFLKSVSNMDTKDRQAVADDPASGQGSELPSHSRVTLSSSLAFGLT